MLTRRNNKREDIRQNIQSGTQLACSGCMLFHSPTHLHWHTVGLLCSVQCHSSPFATWPAELLSTAPCTLLFHGYPSPLSINHVWQSEWRIHSRARLPVIKHHQHHRWTMASGCCSTSMDLALSFSRSTSSLVVKQHQHHRLFLE
jgi:hypothetical protein